LKISHKFKCLFLHNPKTGGTSVREAFTELDPVTKNRVCFLHSDAKYSKAFMDYHGWDWNDYFKFSIVRNPFPRMVSFYEHMRGIGIRHEECLAKLRIEKIGLTNEPTIRKLKELNINIIYDSAEASKYNYASFEDYIKNPIYWMHRLDVKKLDFTINQVDWLSLDGAIAMNLVMRLENIEDDWQLALRYIRNHSGLDIPDIKIGHAKSNPVSVNWKDYYTDELKEIVTKRFKKDLEYFGYSF